MKTTTSVMCSFDMPEAGPVTISVIESVGVIELMQGDSHRVWLPKAEARAFADHLVDWLEQNGFGSDDAQ